METQFPEKINGFSGSVTVFFGGLILVVRDGGMGAGIGLNAPQRKS